MSNNLVDAICIDQYNIEERNTQVRLMKDMYSSCIIDLVWLGEAEGDTQIAIDSLARMKSLNLQRLTDRGHKSFTEKWSEELVSFDDLSLTWDDTEALFKLIGRPSLWERVWVMQEIACAPEVTLVNGNYTIPWSILSSVLDYPGVPDKYDLPFSHQSLDGYVWDAFAKVQSIEHQRESFYLATTLSSALLDVLSRFREICSTDPRDKIYGLLGLATDNLDIIPDYRKSPQEVNFDVTRAQINFSGDLDVVAQSLWPLGHTSAKFSRAKYEYSDRPSSLVENLPSWVPNFSCTISKKILFAQRSIFSAGAIKCTTPIVTSSDGVLQISGVVLGAITIMKPGREIDRYQHDSALEHWIRDWMPDHLADVDSDNQVYVNGWRYL